MDKDWSRYAKELRCALIHEISDGGEMAWTCLKFTSAPYESPKTFTGDFALNGGDWLRFTTGYRTKSGKYTPLRIARKDDAIREIGLYARFLRLLGVDREYELVYHTVVMLAEKTVIRKGAFDCDAKNRELLVRVVRLIMKTDAKPETIERLRDDRQFCIRPERLAKMGAKEKKAWQNKGRMLANSYRIWLKYDETKSVRDNAKEIGVSEATINRFKRRKNEFDKLFEKPCV